LSTELSQLIRDSSTGFKFAKRPLVMLSVRD